MTKYLIHFIADVRYFTIHGLVQELAMLQFV